jgi:hypothetical protein
VGSTACTSLYGGSVVGTPSPVVASTPHCASCSGPTCLGCTPGTDIPYNVTFQNPVVGGVAPGATTQIFDFDVVLRDANGNEMSRTPVRIVVPPIAMNLYLTPGTLRQDYDATYDAVNGTGCMFPNVRSDWGMFTYNVTIPGGTSIRFDFRTAATLAALPAATPISLTVTTTTVNGMFDVGAAFEASTIAGVTNLLPYVSVTSVLNTNVARTLTPTLQSYRLQYSCIDGE